MTNIRSAAVVGAGIIGSSWALVFARAGLPVRIWSRSEERTSATKNAIAAAARALEGTGLGGDAHTLQRISFHGTLTETLHGVDFVQESATEDLTLKQELLRQVEEGAHNEAIIGSSTSGLMPSKLSGALARPERFLVVHPLTPPHLLPIIELCKCPDTHESVVASVAEFLKSVGQYPVLLKAEIPGFALNRILGAMLNECFALIRDGIVTPEDIDPLLTEGFGLRWATIGPFAAMDLNAPGGIAEYLRRYGGIFDLVARSRGISPVLDDALIAQVATSMRPVLDTVDVHTRLSRRDRGIAMLRAARGGR